MGRIGNAQMLGNREGFELSIEMHTDPDTEPYEDDYTTEELEAWDGRRWEYVSLRVTASRSITRLGEGWVHGIEYGWFPAPDLDPVSQRLINPIDSGNDGYAGSDIEDLIGLALANAKAELAQVQIA